MSGVIDKLRKRRFYPVTIGGETVHIRGMVFAEHKEVESFGDSAESWGYAIGCCLLNEDGTLVVSRQADESAKDFGARVLAELNLSDDTRGELIASIVKLSNGPPKIEALAKN